MDNEKSGGQMSLSQASIFVNEIVRAARSGGDQKLNELTSRLFMALIGEYDRGFRNGWQEGERRALQPNTD